jgi:hypothetical protein
VAQARTLLAHAEFEVEHCDPGRARQLLASSGSIAEPLGLTAVLASVAAASARASELE